MMTRGKHSQGSSTARPKVVRSLVLVLRNRPYILWWSAGSFVQYPHSYKGERIEKCCASRCVINQQMYIEFDLTFSRRSLWKMNLLAWRVRADHCFGVTFRLHLQDLKSKALRIIVDAPWYVPNTVIRRDLQILTVKEEIRRYSSQYSARLSAHSNDLKVNPIGLPDNRRLRRHLPNDLPTRFLVKLTYLSSF
jgi:hypothetical protein